MNRPHFALSVIAYILLTGCLPAVDPMVAGRADNAMMRFSAADLTPHLQVTGQ